MDELSAQAVRESFTRLYREGLAYRAEALINWCPGCRTSVSRPRGHPDARRPGRSGRSATTCSAPTGGRARRDDQDRHHPTRDAARRHRGGRQSGRPTVCGARRAPGPDPVRRAGRADHRGRARRAGVRDGRGEDHAGPRPRRLRDGPAPRPADRRRSSTTTAASTRTATASPASIATRPGQRILAELEARGDLVGKRPHEMVIGRCQRSNDVVEPRLKTQWFVRTAPLAAAALEATRGGRTTHPPRRASRRSGRTGSRTSATGTCRDSCGGAIGSRPGTARTAT